MESVDAVENSAGGHGLVRVGPSFELTTDRLVPTSAGEIGFSVEDGEAIMAHLQQVVVNQQCEALGFNVALLQGMPGLSTDQGL